MFSYLAIKHVHISCALISGMFLLLRAYWRWCDAALLSRRWVRILPHAIDTVLLASALTMVFWSGQYPFVQPWLTAKVLALLVYIAAGSIALKRGRSAAVRYAALAVAILSYTYILTVAVQRSPLPFA